MTLSRDKIKKWMKDYFTAFTKYAQEPATVNRMSDYFAPDFKFIPYFWPLQPRNRDDFLLGLAARHSRYEKLTPEDITIDETRKVVVVLIKFEAIDRKTGEILAKERGLLHYQLVFDENNVIKINKIQFFREYLQPGTKTVYDALKGG